MFPNDSRMNDSFEPILFIESTTKATAIPIRLTPLNWFFQWVKIIINEYESRVLNSYCFRHIRLEMNREL